MCFVHVHRIYFIKKEWLFEKKEVSLHLIEETNIVGRVGKDYLITFNKKINL
jgi:hypothetical protein